MNMKLLREVCTEAGVTRRALQGYEKAGLVSAAGKNKYGHLLYDDAGIERIKTVRFLQRTGFSLKEIRVLIDAPPHRRKEALLIQAEKLEAHSEEVSELLRRLRQYILQM